MKNRADYIEVTWGIEDGYVGGSRLQHTYIPREEYEEAETQDDRNILVEEYIQNDFENIVIWYIKHIGD
jgi:hypothetical protein